jgi:hypothetical protein
MWPDEHQNLDRLIDFSYFGFQSTDLETLLESAGHNAAYNPFRNLRENAEKVDTPVQACFLGFISRQDSTYLLYAYKYRQREFGFAWEAFYDDTHRAFDDEEEPPWFDFVSQGQCFKIKIARNDPATHFITERPFNQMNSTVIQLGLPHTGDKEH